MQISWLLQQESIPSQGTSLSQPVYPMPQYFPYRNLIGSWQCRDSHSRLQPCKTSTKESKAYSKLQEIMDNRLPLSQSVSSNIKALHPRTCDCTLASTHLTPEALKTTTYKSCHHITPRSSDIRKRNLATITTSKQRHNQYKNPSILPHVHSDFTLFHLATTQS